MKKGGTHGNSTSTGKTFEEQTNLNSYLKSTGYTMSPKEPDQWEKDCTLWVSIPQGKFKNYFESQGVNFKEIWSKMLRPDEALYNPDTKQLIIIEKKFQRTAGSVDEKLETFPFKKWKYEKLINTGHVSTVQFVFLGNDWFAHPRYQDCKEYLKENGVQVAIGGYPSNLLEPLQSGA